MFGDVRSGFIGSHIIRHLLERGYETVCLENFDPTYDINAKKVNIASFVGNNNFELVERDIQDIELLKRTIVDIEIFSMKLLLYLSLREHEKSCKDQYNRDIQYP